MKNLYTIILAGGAGSRLKSLTKNECKPMVKIGGNFHLIDFTLTNCLISGSTNIGVVVQYNPNNLINYLLDWKLFNNMNLDILPPKSLSNYDNVKIYDTAHAVYLNKDVINKSDCEDILILSCDHVYTVDYSKFYKQHKEAGADLTVITTEVSLDEASRFGIFTLNKDNKILSFEEKPEIPKSNIASTGIYIFNKNKLLSFIKNYINEIDEHVDFGRNVIPFFIEKYKTQICNLDTFWSDVGTIESFWKINMQTLDINHKEFKNHYFKIKSFLTRNSRLLPSLYGSSAIITNSLVNNGNYIEGTIEHSVIGNNNYIEDGSKIINSVIMDQCIIKKNVIIKNAIISDKSIVEEDVGVDGKITLI